MKARLSRFSRVAVLALVLCLSLIGTALAASTASISAPVDGATSLSGSVTLDTGATLDTGHYYTIDGGANTPLTVDGSGAFTVDISALADGNHTVQIVVKVDEDGAGANPAVDRSATRSFAVASGAVSVAAPATGTGLTFTMPTDGLGSATSDSLLSMSPLFFIVGGLVIAGGIVGFGVRLLKSWRG